MDEIFRRTDVIQRREAVKRKLVSSAAGSGVRAAALVFLLITLPGIGLQASSGDTWRYGGLLLNGAAGGYILVAVVALALGYYLIIASKLLQQESALPHPEKLALGAVAILLVVLQGLTFAVGAAVRSILDVVCTGMMALSILFFFAKSIIALRRGSVAVLPLTFGGFGWILVCLYMSAGVPYLVIALCVTLIFSLMYQAVKGRVMAA